MFGLYDCSIFAQLDTFMISQLCHHIRFFLHHAPLSSGRPNMGSLPTLRQCRPWRPTSRATPPRLPLPLHPTPTPTWPPSATRRPLFRSATPAWRQTPSRRRKRRPLTGARTSCTNPSRQVSLFIKALGSFPSHPICFWPWDCAPPSSNSLTT